MRRGKAVRVQQWVRGFLAVCRLPFAVLAIVLGYGTAAAQYAGGEPRLVSSGPEGVEIEIGGADYRRSSAVADGRRYDRVDLPGAVWLPQPGHPAVPVRGALIGIPYGVDVSVAVVDAAYDEVPGVDLMPVPETYTAGRGDLRFPAQRYAPDAAAYARDAFYPAQQVAVPVLVAQRLDQALPAADPLGIAQRVAQPLPQQPRPHRVARAIDRGQQGVGPRPAPQRALTTSR